jgi:hypothetical protein
VPLNVSWPREDMTEILKAQPALEPAVKALRDIFSVIVRGDPSAEVPPDSLRRASLMQIPT